MPAVDDGTKEWRLIYSLLETYATLESARDFLSVRKIPHTATSWNEFIKERLRPAVQSGQLSRAAVLGLLREAEEHGHQHVFLYQCDPAEAGRLMAKPAVRAALKTLNREAVIADAAIIDTPKASTIVDARWGELDDHGTFTLKVVGVRMLERRTREKQSDNRTVIMLDYVPTRTVGLFRLQENGQLDLRIESRTNETNYKAEVHEMWSTAALLLPREKFEEVSLGPAKKKMFLERTKLRDKIHFKSVRGGSAKGNSMTVACGDPDPDSDFADDQPMEKGLEGVLQSGGACERSGLFFLKNQILRRDLRVNLLGADHQYILPASCSAAEYEHVLSELKGYNR